MKVPENLTYSHILTFMYFSFSHLADGEVAKEEVDMMIYKLKEWDENYNKEIWDQTLEWYDSFEEGEQSVGEQRWETFVNSASFLKEKMSKENLQAVVNDIKAIAKSDGHFDEMEHKWVDMLEEIFELG